MSAKSINMIVLNEFYNFILQYYNDITLADYIMKIFSIERSDISKSDVSYEKFLRILHYLQRMSGDMQICYNAGRYFSKSKLIKDLTIPGIRFSLKKTFSRIDEIIEEFFPILKISIKSMKGGTIILSIDSTDSSILRSFYFIEYIKGIISSIPNCWDLPSASISVESYPFTIEDILKDIDVPYHKKDSSYFIYNNQIAEDKLLKADSENENNGRRIQVLKDDIYIKDIYIKRETLLNSVYLNLKIKWISIDYIKTIVFLALGMLGISFFAIFLAAGLHSPFLITLFILYEIFILLIYDIYKRKELKSIYIGIESSLLSELNEHKRAAGEAINSTTNRLRSIENLVEISKRIIHEKNIVNLFDNIRKLSAKALNADRTTVFIHDKENRELRSGPELSEEKKEFRIPEDKGIVGEVFKLKKIVNVKDAYNNPHFNKAVDRKTGYETKTILGAPLLDLDGNFIGVIQVLNKNDGEFQKIDEDIIETLSTYIASSLKDTLTIRNLEQRGLDPDLINGLNIITKHIFSEYNIIYSTIKRFKHPDIDAITPKMNSITLLLEKLIFLFEKAYTLKETPFVIKDIFESFRMFVANNKQDKRIIYEDQMSIPLDKELVLDRELLNMAVCEILINSIESIDNEGEIVVWMHNYVVVPNDITHELSINEIISEYNAFSEENYAGFIGFITGRRPFLESDLKKIKDSMKEFIAIEFFDTGSLIEDEIKEKIFHPFFSTKGRFGLGLAIAKTALNRMGGMIEGPIYSKKGKSIRLLIPVKK